MNGDIGPGAKCPANTWWQTGIIYEAYVRSFQDTNGDGIGDINGIRQRLDYLQWLGVDILWIPPIYKSPQVEFGYDIADFIAIDPLFGTMDDFDMLLREAHQRNIRIVLDITPNHTSDQHQWFVDSRSSRANPRSDWYIWKDPAHDGGPPNNWVSAFGGGSAWEYDEGRRQYYYHAFMKQQPDLNWRNPEVETAFFDCLRFWLDRGVDGFRMDVMWHLMKDERFRDNPPSPDYDPKTMPSNNRLRELFDASRPETIDLVVRMRDLLQQYDGERLLIGELYQSGEDLINYYGPRGEGAQIPHNQQLILLPWEAPVVRDAIEKYEGTLPAECWPNWVLGNHDKPRVATRAKSQAQARVARMMLLTLRGTPTLYYGDEIGMENVDISEDQVRDPFEKLDPGRGQGRDPQRTPMQWNPQQQNAGFTSGEPWLPLAHDWRQVNVESQKQDSQSILNLTKKLIDLRRAESALACGQQVMIHTEQKGPLICFIREDASARFVIALNLTKEPASFQLPHGYERVEFVMSTIPDTKDLSFYGTVNIRPNEGMILKVL